MKYAPIRNQPVARFWYKGTHTHPVRRTVLITENRPDIIIGYELREGNEVRLLKSAPIKSYRKDKIAGRKSLRKGSPDRRNTQKPLFVRENLLSVIETGI